MNIGVNNSYNTLNLHKDSYEGGIMEKQESEIGSNVPYDYRNRTTKPFTSYMKSKPPQQSSRGYKRENSLGARLKHNYSRESLVTKPSYVGVNNSISNEYAKLKSGQHSSRKNR